VFSILPSRARYVAQSILGTHDGQQPKGVIVSDRYAAYAFVDPDKRQVCWAHLMRDFSRISQRDCKPGRIGHTLLGAAYLLFRYRKQPRPAQAYARL
jgi:transposase